MDLRNLVLIVAFALASARPVNAADLLVTQYKNDPSGAPYGITSASAISEGGITTR